MSMQSLPLNPLVESRVNQSVTAAVERRILVWLAARVARWMTSDALTALGLAAQIAAGAGYAVARFDRRWLLAVCLCIALNWLGDSLDGTVARVRRQQRPRYGFYIDHVVDCFGAVALMTGMACSGFLHWQVAVAMLVGFLVLSAESYLAAHTLGAFEMSKGIFGPTEIRILLVVGNLVLLRSPYSTILGHRFLLFDVGGTIAAIGMACMAIAVTVRHAAQLYRQEPLP